LALATRPVAAKDRGMYLAKGPDMSDQTDLAAIRAVVMDYLEGMIYGDADQFARAFHPKAVAAGSVEGDYFASGRDEFILEWLALDSLPRGTPFVHEIGLIDVTSDVAMVRLTDTYLATITPII
jgi:hypothetical protein